MAHPDDAEIFCAGSLALLARQGWEIHIASMTPGDLGSMEMSASETAATRRKEGAAAAARIGASYHCLDRRDMHIFYDAPTLQAVSELLRSLQPDLVFTHPPQDYMPDHEMTSLTVRAACFAAPIPNFDTGRRPAAAAAPKIPHLYYSSPAEGTDIFGQPAEFSVYVDVTEVIDEKAGMLACHDSQREWLRRRHGMDQYIESMREWSARLGERAGTAFAEGFRQHVGHPYPADDLLAELLGGVRP